MHALIASVIEVTRESSSAGIDGVERRRRDDERASIDLENNRSESCDMVNFGGATSAASIPGMPEGSGEGIVGLPWNAFSAEHSCTCQRWAERERKGLEPIQLDCWAVDLLEETDVCTFRCE